jgi:hypothetical protein
MELTQSKGRIPALISLGAQSSQDVLEKRINSKISLQKLENIRLSV